MRWHPAVAARGSVMKSVRIGILGCGKVSHMYLPILVRTPAVEIVAVADVDPIVIKGSKFFYGGNGTQL